MIDSLTMGTAAVGNLYQMINSTVNVASMEAVRESCLRIQQTIEDTGQSVQDNTDQHKKLNDEIDEGAKRSEKLKKVVGKVTQAFRKMNVFPKTKEWIEDCTAAYDRQLSAELQLAGALANRSDTAYTAQYQMEGAGDTPAVTAAYDQITAKAGEIQGQGIYSDEVMIGAAAELTTYFTDTDAIGMMMDTLADYAMGVTGGGEMDSAGMAALAADLGKTTSGDYSAMSASGFEFSEAQKAIIQGEATREQIVSVLGDEYLDMSSDMQAAAAIAQVVGESWSGIYESMSRTPEGKILQLANAWNGLKESIGGQMYPSLLLFVGVITENWGTIQTVLDGITVGLEFMLGFISLLAEGAMYFAQMIMDNWGWISPILYGVIAALAVYNGAMVLAWLSTLKSAAAMALKTACDWVEIAAIIALIVAQDGLNAALAACPISWIIILVIALIAAFYAVIGIMNRLTGSSISATGLIAGAFGLLTANIMNTFIVPLWNQAAALANFFGNVFNNPVAAVKVLFYDMCLNVLDNIRNMAGAVEGLLNKIPGVEIDITSGLEGFYSKLEEAQKAVKDESGWVEYVHKMDYKDYGAAWDKGYSFGQGMEESISDFDPASLFGGGLPGIDEYLNLDQNGNGFGGDGSGLEDPGGGPDGIGTNVDDIAGNTGSMAESMELSGEDLQYLRDIAEQEAINRFTTAEIKIEQTNHNQINSGMDLDGIVSGLDDALGEAIEIMTEGVHT